MQNLNIGHVNIRSITSNFMSLKDTIVNNNYDIFAVSETWLSNRIDNEHIAIDNYKFVRSDRSSRGGGVGLYIKDYLKFEMILAQCDDALEQLWIKFKIKQKFYTLGVLYRPPQSNFNSFLNLIETSATSLLNDTDYFIFTGDVNINIFDTESIKTKQFEEMLDVYNLTQIVTDPTRITQTSCTLIDVFVISDSKLVQEIEVLDGHNLADHDIINCKLLFTKKKTEPIIKTYRNFRNFNYESFNHDLQLLDLDHIFYLQDVDQKLEYFNDCIQSLFNKHAPLKTARLTKPYSPWLTDTIREMMRLRDQAYQNYKKTRTQAKFNYYKTLRNLVNKAVLKEKKAVIEHKITNNNNMWTELKKLNILNFKNKSSIPIELKDVNKINDFFISSTKNDFIPDQDLITFYSSNTKPSVNPFNFHMITENDILKIISNIKSKATGHDGININMIKLCCPYILPFLVHIFNSCIEKSVFPNSWKMSCIIPLPKKATVTELGDLRPISILPALSKIMERIMFIQLNEHLDKYNILPNSQSGFRQNFSCATLLTNITDDIIRALDTDLVTILILLDYSKAFDTIDHTILISILHYIGVASEGITFLTSYLTDRFQVVTLDQNESAPVRTTRGVPQGSILGPILFCIYCITLLDKLKFCSGNQYADDSQLQYSFRINNINDACNKINEDLENLALASKKHSLKLNPNKSVALFFGPKSTDLKNIGIQINNIKIPVLESSKNLGLIIDNNLRFRNHINMQIKKSFSILKLLYPQRHILSPKIKLQITNSLVLSLFDYCDVVYGPCLDVITKNRIQRVQNACVRFSLGIRKYDSVSAKIKEIGWLTMEKRRLYHTLCYYHKIITTKCPPYLYNKISYRTDVHHLNLRHIGLITVPKHKTTTFERSFTYNMYKLYNNLPDFAKNFSLTKFKKYQLEFLLK